VENQKQEIGKFRRGKEMRYIRLAVLFSVMILILAAGCVSAFAQAQWKVVIPQTLFKEKLRIAAFLNDSFGLTGGAGDPGKADYTLDGGKTWASADSSGG
jgi:hypothetical protein